MGYAVKVNSCRDGDWNPGLTRVFSAIALGYSHYLQYKGLKRAKCSSFLCFPSLQQGHPLSRALLYADP